LVWRKFREPALGPAAFILRWLAQREKIITKVCARPRTAKFRKFLATGPQPRGRGQAPKARACRRDMLFPVFNGSRSIAGAARFVPQKNPSKFPSSRLIAWLEGLPLVVNQWRQLGVASGKAARGSAGPAGLGAGDRIFFGFFSGAGGVRIPARIHFFLHKKKTVRRNRAWTLEQRGADYGTPLAAARPQHMCNT
jgi:hypothetical protein